MGCLFLSVFQVCDTYNHNDIYARLVYISAFVKNVHYISRLLTLNTLSDSNSVTSVGVRKLICGPEIPPASVVLLHTKNGFGRLD